MYLAQSRFLMKRPAIHPFALNASVPASARTPSAPRVGCSITGATTACSNFGATQFSGNDAADLLEWAGVLPHWYG
jgi:hypothetical protein